MDTNLGMCEVCEDEPALYVMIPIATDETRSNGGVVNLNMCHDCAWKAWDDGTHESDIELTK